MNQTFRSGRRVFIGRPIIDLEDPVDTIGIDSDFVCCGCTVLPFYTTMLAIEANRRLDFEAEDEAAPQISF